MFAFLSVVLIISLELASSQDFWSNNACDDAHQKLEECIQAKMGSYPDAIANFDHEDLENKCHDRYNLNSSIV